MMLHCATLRLPAQTASPRSQPFMIRRPFSISPRCIAVFLRITPFSKRRLKRPYTLRVAMSNTNAAFLTNTHT